MGHIENVISIKKLQVENKVQRVHVSLWKLLAVNLFGGKACLFADSKRIFSSQKTLTMFMGVVALRYQQHPQK